MRALWLAQHGETEWSLAGKHTGSTDIDLTAAGVEQGLALRRRLSETDFEVVLTSPLIRASRTAELAGFPSAEHLDDLAEFLYGDYEGLTTNEIRERRPNWNIWSDGCPGGETYQDVARRVDRVLGRLTAVGGDVLVFSHGHTTRVIAARFTGSDELAGSLGKPAPSSVSIFGCEHGRPVLRKWNQT